jgi:phenylpropionate dioxygenase-like ring-hydroxylating dioxygenase large terminal subunit
MTELSAIDKENATGIGYSSQSRPATAIVARLAGEPIVQNCWYVAAWASELPPGGILGRTLMGRPLVLWRELRGTAHAMEDRCPHRQAPLSRGRLEETGLRCMYHGLVFNGSGRCVAIPSERAVPNLVTPVVPLVERHALLWFWAGDPAAADPDYIPDTHWLDDPAWVGAPGYVRYDAPQQLIIDNLLDFSHLAFVHETTLGGSMDWAKIPPRVHRHRKGVTVEFLHKNQPIPPYLKDVASFPGPVDRWTNYDWLIHGNILSIDHGIAPHGTVTTEVHPENAIHHHSVQALTPETVASTHYFWSLPRDYALENEEVTRILHEQVARAFDEDKTMIEAQARNIAAFDRFATGAIPADMALLHVRKLMRECAAASGIRAESYSDAS